MGNTALSTQDTARPEVGTRMATAATTWLASLDAGQRAVGAMRKPGEDAESEAERLRWFYTPTDHGGLTVHEQSPAQQHLAMALVASGLIRNRLSRPLHLAICDIQLCRLLYLSGTVSVLHYDVDFDVIAEVTGQPTRWVLPPGDAERG